MRPMHSLLFSLGIFARQFRNGRETNPVRGNADCPRCVRETFWGERGEKLRSSGKELILSLLFRYFTTGAQNVQFVIMIRKWATVGGCRYSVMRYYHAFGKI